MQHSVEFDCRHNYFRVVTWGDANVAGFTAFANALGERPDWRPDIPVLIDHSLLVIDKLGANETQQIVTAAMQIKQHLGDFKTAIVTSSQFGFGLARMWQLRVESVDHSAEDQLKIFHSRAEALAWLLPHIPGWQHSG